MTHPRRFPLRSSAALLLIAALSLSACASKPDRRGPPSERQGGQERPTRTSGTFMYPVAVLFSGMDRDSDTLISRAEVRNGVQAEWASFDMKPSAIQFSNWSIRNLGSTDSQPSFMNFDRDFNGVISEVEFTTLFEKEFEKLDKNGDGQIARSEMIIAFNAPEGQSRERGGQGGGGQKGQGGGRPPR